MGGVYPLTGGVLARPDSVVMFIELHVTRRLPAESCPPMTNRLTLDRATMWDVTCPNTDTAFRVVFWDCHEEEKGKRRMAYAVFVQNPTFPTCYQLAARTSRFYPSALYSCDGEEAARAAVAWTVLDKMCESYIICEELEVSETEQHAEGVWEEVA